MLSGPPHARKYRNPKLVRAALAGSWWSACSRARPTHRRTLRFSQPVLDRELFAGDESRMNERGSIQSRPQTRWFGLSHKCVRVCVRFSLFIFAFACTSTSCVYQLFVGNTHAAPSASACPLPVLKTTSTPHQFPGLNLVSLHPQSRVRAHLPPPGAADISVPRTGETSNNRRSSRGFLTARVPFSEDDSSSRPRGRRQPQSPGRA